MSNPLYSIRAHDIKVLKLHAEAEFSLEFGITLLFLFLLRLMHGWTR